MYIRIILLFRIGLSVLTVFPDKFFQFMSAFFC